MLPKPLLKSDIERAMRMTKSNRAASRYLSVSYQHYKKWAKNFKADDNDPNSPTLFEKHKNQAGRGISKFLPNNGKNPPLNDILEGRVSIDSYTPEKLKARLIQEGYLQECCSICDFAERRVTDYKVPLLVNFKDGNKKNWSLDNLEMLCYNHYFLNVGNIFTDRQLQHIEDYNPPPTSTQEVDWELDEWYKEHLTHLGLLDTEKEAGEEFISKI
jgi:hypothetical protein